MRAEYFPADSIAAPGILPLRVRALGLRINGTDLLAGVNFNLARGGPTVVLGANGAGKTLLLKLCHGLLRPSTGEVIWEGVEAADSVQRQAMVFQRPVLLRRSVAANIDYALATRGLGRAECRRRVTKVLDETGLTSLANRAARG